MPEVLIDGIKLYCESTGEGVPIVFAHEFAGDLTSWELQVRFFSRKYRVVTYNARGFPPSSVPENLSDYSQDIATTDLAGIIKSLDLAPAHIVGTSMGAYTAVHLGLRYPQLARSIVVASCGYGSEPEGGKGFQNECLKLADLLETRGIEEFLKVYAPGPSRAELKRKDPRGFSEFVQKLRTQSIKGLANTLRGVQAARPSVYDLKGRLEKMETPTLILAGDTDGPCLMPSIFLKQTIPNSALAFFPSSGHMVNLEEPILFHNLVQDFITQVDRGERSLGKGS